MGVAFGGHHVSLNNLVVDGRVVATCFLGADPAASPLLGAVLRPLAGPEDLARELVRSLDPELAARAVLLPRAPSDIVGGNRTRIGEGDEVIPLSGIWRGRFADPAEQQRLQAVSDGIDAATGLDPNDHDRIAVTTVPKGVPRCGTTPGSASCSTRCWPPTSAASLTRSVRWAVRREHHRRQVRSRRRAPGVGGLDDRGGAALLPTAGTAPTRRVRQYAAAGERRTRGVARPGVRLRARRARRPPHGVPPLSSP